MWWKNKESILKENGLCTQEKLNGLIVRKAMDLLRGEDGEDIFVHRSGIIEVFEPVIFENDIVEYEVEEDKFGRTKAVNVSVISKHKSL